MFSESRSIRSRRRHKASAMVVWAPLLFSQWTGSLLSCSLVRWVSRLWAAGQDKIFDGTHYNIGCSTTKHWPLNKYSNIPRIPCQHIFQNLVIGVQKAPTFERFVPLADSWRIGIQALDVLQIGLRVQHPLGLWRRGDKHGGAGLQVWWLAGVRRRSVWSGAIHARLKIR